MISKSFARCIAKISGDGSLCKNYLRYHNTSRVLLNEFEEDMRTEFGDIKLTKGIQNSGTSFLQTNRGPIIRRFFEILPDYRSNALTVPTEIKQSPKEIKKEYLRALYDDEGSPNLRIFNKTNEWKRNITLTSNSFILLQEIKQILLNDFDIKTNNIIRNRSNSDYDKTFVLGITGKDNFISFQKQINFKIPYKIERVRLIVQSYGNTFKRNISGFNEIKRKLDLVYPLNTLNKKVEQRF